MTNEEMEKEIRDKLRSTPIAGDFDRTRAIYPNEAVIEWFLTFAKKIRARAIFESAIRGRIAQLENENVELEIRALERNK